MWGDNSKCDSEKVQCTYGYVINYLMNTLQNLLKKLSSERRKKIVKRSKELIISYKNKCSLDEAKRNQGKLI